MTDDEFGLPVSINGNELLFPSRLVRFGYTYKIEVDINGSIVSFEKDDQGDWRAITDPSNLNNKTLTTEMITAVIQTLDSLS